MLSLGGRCSVALKRAPTLQLYQSIGASVPKLQLWCAAQVMPSGTEISFQHLNCFPVAGHRLGRLCDHVVAVYFQKPLPAWMDSSVLVIFNWRGDPLGTK